MIKRWGMVDHESALSFFLDKLYRARRDWEERTAGRFSHSANIRADTIYALQRVFAGWARSDSKAAWEHFLDLESEHRKMGLFPEIIGNSGPMPAEMTRSLAKDHPEFAFSEFQRAGLSPDLGAELRPSLLAGLAEELPDEADWAVLFKRLENELRNDSCQTLRVAQGALFGRWLEADLKAAELWYESDTSKAIFRGAKRMRWREDLREFRVCGDLIPLGEAPLVRAATHWFFKDQKGATRWFRDHQDLIPAIFVEFRNTAPDASERKGLRRLLGFCLHKTERESLIRGMMGGNRLSFRGSFQLLVNLNDEPVFQSEMAELGLNNGFVAEIMEALETPDLESGEFGDIDFE